MPRLPRAFLPGLLCLALLPLPATADDDQAVRLSLSAVSEREADNDLLGVTLQVERRGEDTARLAREVREIMERALQTGREYPAVRQRTPAYTTQPVYERRDGETRQTGWRIIQTLELESTDLEAATELVGRLQQGELRVTHMGFGVSRENRERIRRELTDEAIDLWLDKAAAAARRLHASHWAPAELSIHDEMDGPPVRPLMARAMDTVEAAPAVEAGTSRIRVQVSGSVAVSGILPTPVQ